MGGALLILAMLPVSAFAASLTFTSQATTTFTAGVAGSFLVTTDPPGPPAPSITDYGTLPIGVGFVDNQNGTATLSGTPAAGSNSTYVFTITAVSGAGAANQTFILSVNPGASGPPAFTSAASATFTPSVYRTFSVTASGTPTPYISLYSGSAPGLTFTPGTGTASLSGTPTVAGTYTFQFAAASTSGTVYQTFTLTVGSGALAFTSAASTTFTPSVYSAFSVTASGTPTPYISLYSGSAPGLTFTPGYSTASLSGTPTVAGTYTFQFAAASTSGTVYQTFTLTVGAGNNLTFVTQPGGGQPGVAWSQQPVVSVRDNYGNLVSTPVTITLAISTNPGAGTLYCSGGTSVYTTSGYAYFTGCTVSAAGVGYTLVASSSGLASTTSVVFNIGSAVTPVTPVTLTGASALGASATSGFSTPTKILAVGQSITIRVQSSPQLAGIRLGVWIAKKNSNGTWGAYSPHTSVTTDATGTAYYTYTFGSNAWLAFRLYFGGSTTYAPAWSYPSQFGRAL
jgi:hypothetical protein